MLNIVNIFRHFMLNYSVTVVDKLNDQILKGKITIFDRIYENVSGEKLNLSTFSLKY